MESLAGSAFCSARLSNVCQIVEARSPRVRLRMSLHGEVSYSRRAKMRIGLSLLASNAKLYSRRRQAR
jgi:hypothetical protein